MNKLGKLLTLTIIATSLSSCGLFGPSYKKPDSSAPKTWASKDSGAKIDDSINLPDMAWWKKFNDPVLNDLIAKALKNNNDIQTAIGNIIKAAGILETTHMGWVPTMTGTVSYTTSGPLFNSGNSNAIPSIGGSGAASGFSPGYSEGYSAGFQPQYNLNIFQQIKAQDRDSAGLLSKEFAKDATRLSIIAQVAGGYFQLLGYMNDLKLQQALTTDYQKQWELGKKQYELGYISLQTLQQSEQNYYTAKAQIPVLENNIVKSQNALKVLINENPGKVVTKQDFMALDSNGIIPANLPSKVLENRPDVRQAEETLIADNASIGYARANFFPSIQLTSNIGATSNVLSGLFSTGALGYSLNPDVLIPIFNLSYLGNIKQARGQYYADYYAYIKTIRNAFKDVDNGLSAHDKLTESFKTKELNYSSAKTAYTLADARYQDGADSYVTALNTKIKMENAAVILSNSKLDQLNSVVGLYQALAGGYNVDNTDKPNKFGDGHDS